MVLVVQKIIYSLLRQENRKIALGLKLLTPDPWPDIVKSYPVGLEVEGTVSKITNFGVFLELEPGLEGLLHISELKEPAKGKPADVFKVGDKIKVRIAKADAGLRKISLTMKP